MSKIFRLVKANDNKNDSSLNTVHVATLNDAGGGVDNPQVEMV